MNNGRPDRNEIDILAGGFSRFPPDHRVRSRRRVASPPGLHVIPCRSVVRIRHRAD